MLTLYKTWCDPTIAVEEEAEEEKEQKVPVKPDFKQISELCQGTKNADTGEKTSYEGCLVTLLESVFELKEE